MRKVEPSLMVKKDGMILENSFFKGKEGRVGFRKNSFRLKILQMSAMKVYFQIAECS